MLSPFWGVFHCTLQTHTLGTISLPPVKTGNDENTGDVGLDVHPRSITNTLHLSATINHEHRPRAFLPPWQNTTVPVILTGTIYNVSSHLQCAISIVTYRCQRERPRNVPQRETFWLRPPFLTGMELPATNSSMVPFSLQMWPPALSSMQ